MIRGIYKFNLAALLIFVMGAQAVLSCASGPEPVWPSYAYDIQLDDNSVGYDLPTLRPYHMYRDIMGLDKYVASDTDYSNYLILSDRQNKSLQEYLNIRRSIFGADSEYIVSTSTEIYQAYQYDAAEVCFNRISNFINIYNLRKNISTKKDIQYFFKTSEMGYLNCVVKKSERVSGLYDGMNMAYYNFEDVPLVESSNLSQPWYTIVVNFFKRIFSQRAVSKVGNYDMAAYDDMYFSAAKEFYQKDFDSAINNFSKIYDDKNNPWRSYAAYSLGRSYIAKANTLLDDNYWDQSADKDLHLDGTYYSFKTKNDKDEYVANMKLAGEIFNKIIADKSIADIKDDAAGLFNYAEFRYDYNNRIKKAENILNKKTITQTEVDQNLPDIYKAMYNLRSDSPVESISDMEAWLGVMIFGPNRAGEYEYDQANSSTTAPLSNEGQVVLNNFRSKKDALYSLAIIQPQQGEHYYTFGPDIKSSSKRERVADFASKDERRAAVKVLDRIDKSSDYYGYVLYSKLSFVLDYRNEFTKDEIKMYKIELNQFINRIKNSKNSEDEETVNSYLIPFKDLSYLFAENVEEAFSSGGVSNVDLDLYDIDTIYNNINNADKDFRGVMRATVLSRAFKLGRYDLIDKVVPTMYGSGGDFDKLLKIIETTTDQDKKLAAYIKLVTQNEGFQDCYMYKVGHGYENSPTRTDMMFNNKDILSARNSEMQYTDIGSEVWLGKVLTSGKLKSKIDNYPELLSDYIKVVTRYSSCKQDESVNYSKEVFEILHTNYPDSTAAQNTEYYY